MSYTSVLSDKTVSTKDVKEVHQPSGKFFSGLDYIKSVFSALLCNLKHFKKAQYFMALLF